MDIPQPTIIRSSRSTLSLQITARGEVIVKAPRLIPTFLIRQFVRDKEDWIRASLAKIEKHTVQKKQYVEGEEFWYLGKIYTLKLGNFTEISISDTKERSFDSLHSLRMTEQNTLYFPKALLFRAKKELENWYIRKAKEKITQRVQYQSEQMGREYTRLLFSDTSSKWGTCFPDNSLQFNWRLIMAPLVVLDYVVIHELAHTKEKNHGERFWKLVEKYTPAYKSHRRWLNNHAHLLTF